MRATWISTVIAVIGCGPATPGAAPVPPPAVALWVECESLFNRGELDKLSRCFTDAVDFEVASVSGTGWSDLRARIDQLRERNPRLRSRTRLLLYRDDIAVAIVVIEAAKPERAAQLVQFVARLSAGKIAALRLHMDPFVFGRANRPIRFTATGQLAGREPTNGQRRWLRALETTLSDGAAATSPVTAGGSIHYAAAGELRGPEIQPFLREYTQATEQLTYRLIPVLGAGEWIVAEGEWHGPDGASSGPAQGILARVRDGAARELWLFDPVLSASALTRGRGPRH